MTLDSNASNNDVSQQPSQIEIVPYDSDNDTGCGDTVGGGGREVVVSETIPVVVYNDSDTENNPTPSIAATTSTTCPAPTTSQESEGWQPVPVYSNMDNFFLLGNNADGDSDVSSLPKGGGRSPVLSNVSKKENGTNYRYTTSWCPISSRTADQTAPQLQLPSVSGTSNDGVEHYQHDPQVFLDSLDSSRVYRDLPSTSVVSPTSTVRSLA